MTARDPHAARLREWLLSRTYTDQSDGMWTDYPSTEPEPFFSTCGYCGWDGPCRDTRAESEHDRWRHPNALCWLRASWIDYGTWLLRKVGIRTDQPRA